MTTTRGRLMGLAAMAGLGACADLGDENEPVPLGIQVTPLTGIACGDPDNPNPGGDPFATASSVTVAVRAFDPVANAFKTLAKKSQTLKSGKAMKLSVAEGPDRDVILFARGSTESYYGRDTGLDVVRNTDTAAAMALTRYDGFSCAPVPPDVQNTIFPAVVTLGDGRILVAGGFTQVSSDGGTTKLTGATSEAWLFDPRTGLSEVLPNLGAGEGRAGATMVYLAETNKVLILGGTTEMNVDTSLPFPFSIDPSKSKDDYILFDPVTKTFTAGTKRMRSARAFARAAELADGTVLVTGGGPWPLRPTDTFVADTSDIFDPEDNDRAGGFLDIPKMRTFFPRAGHSLTFLGKTPEGLTQLLIWGGTTPDASLGNPAELYKQSGRQQDGVNGTFAQVQLYGSEFPTFTFFQEVTRLSNNRFVATGGAYYDGGMKAPRADETWLMTFDDKNGGRSLVVQRIPGLGEGRVFHTAISDDLRHVAVIGGWGPVDAIAAPNHVMTFDADAAVNALPFWTQATAAASMTAPRGGHGATLTPAGTIFVVGGEASFNGASAVKRGAAEIYTPAFVPLP